MASLFTKTIEQFNTIQEWFSKELSVISTGTINPAMFDSVQASVYGSIQPIKSIASIHVEGPRTVKISPWDTASISAIETGLRDSGIPVSISSDGTGVRVMARELTEESRKDIVKLLGKKHEEARVSVRTERERAIKELDTTEKAGEITEDEKFSGKEEIQKLVDATNTKLEKMFELKEVEVMKI